MMHHALASAIHYALDEERCAALAQYRQKLAREAAELKAKREAIEQIPHRTNWGRAIACALPALAFVVALAAVAAFIAR
jgi:hypothetical protein